MGGLKVASWPGSGGDLNPFINIFVDALEGIGCEVINVEKFPAKDFPEVSVLVVHWPQFIYKESFGKFSKVVTLLQFLTLLLRLKKTGVRIVWICHDLEPHDRNELDMEGSVVAYTAYHVSYVRRYHYTLTKDHDVCPATLFTLDQGASRLGLASKI